MTNTGTASAAVSGVAVTGDFTQTNTCGTSIAAGASCTVNVSFRPTASGTRTGTLTITSNATNSPTTVALSGTGAGHDGHQPRGRQADQPSPATPTSTRRAT